MEKGPKKSKQDPRAPKGRYTEGIGRRKTAVARVRFVSGPHHFTVNGKKLEEYFFTERLRRIAQEPFEKLKIPVHQGVSVRVHGGGIMAQAEAVRHGLSRALVATDEGLKKHLRQLGFLTRDPRMVERKKYGLKKARRAPQWAKR